MKISAESKYRIGRISQNQQIANIYRGITLKLNVMILSDSALLLRALEIVSNYDSAPARELFIFAAAIIQRHRIAQAQYSVAIRRSA